MSLVFKSHYQLKNSSTVCFFIKCFNFSRNQVTFTAGKYFRRKSMSLQYASNDLSAFLLIINAEMIILQSLAITNCMLIFI